MTRLLGVVLAGGQSSRMGRDKATLRHPSSATFLQYALNLLRPLCAEVAVSVGQRDAASSAAEELADVTVLEDPVAGLGPAVGVATAVQAAAQRSLTAALVIPVDMPALTTLQLLPLIDAHRNHPRDLVVATSERHARYEPLLAIYPVRFAAALQQLAGSEHRSLNAWLSGQRVRQVVLIDAAAANVNTPEQLADYQRHHEATHWTMTVAGQSPPPFSTPDAAIAALAQRLAPVDVETISLLRAAGRILRVAVSADRDSPAADVSAMDGYALRTVDLMNERSLPVSGESVPGHPPPAVQPGHVVRIFTGAVVPSGMELVVRREDTEETPHQVRLLPPALNAVAGQNIRRQGENAVSGSQVLSPGGVLHAGAVAAAANFGAQSVQVSLTVRVAILVTGDELQPVGADVSPWQLRDSNGPTLRALLAARPWIEVVSVESVEDSVERIKQVLNDRLRGCDAVVLTGGVSMGDYDHVPEAVRACGGEVVFHKLPIRPGKPILGAATGDGRLVLGLPGNPVSVAVGARRILLPLLRHLAGGDRADASRPTVTLASAVSRSLPLYWYRLIRIDATGSGSLVPTRGSGDIVSMAASTGFIEQPPNDPSPGPWPYWAWCDD